MLITLYKTNDSNNTINKTLIEPQNFDIVFKEKVDIHNPTIKLKAGFELINFNYCFIPVFNRYYFITNIEIETNQLYILSCRCDVLESFKSEILLCDGYIKRNNEPNYFLNSGDYEKEIRKENDIYYSDVTIPKEYNIVLTTFVRGE